MQRIAVDRLERVLSVTLMSTSPAGPGAPEHPELPPISDELRALFSSDQELAEPDWSDREAAITFLLESERPYAGVAWRRRDADARAARPRL